MHSLYLVTYIQNQTDKDKHSGSVCRGTCSRLQFALTQWDTGRLFVLPMPGDPEWTRMYLVEYLRPCTPEEVPETQPADATAYEFFDVNTKNSSSWRSHQQGEVLCALNILSGKRKRTQTAPLPPTSGRQEAFTVAKSMLGRKSDYDNIYSEVRIRCFQEKGQWHVVHFLGNDYSSSNSSLPKTSPIFHKAFQSVHSLRDGNPLLLFTNVREQCKPYTGMVQDGDFEVGTEVFDDGHLPLDKGKRLTQESWERVLALSHRYQKQLSFDLQA